MNEGDKEDSKYKVVVNHEEQYSIWIANRANPPGWRDAAKSGTKSECLAYIKEVWTDMRPLSLRNRMDEPAMVNEVTSTHAQIPERSRILTSAFSNEAWIAGRKPNPQAHMRLFCFPYAGGTPSVFRNWSDGLPADVEVCPVQLPGRGTRLMEPPFSQLPPLIEALAEALLPLLDKPFALFGHSLGSLLSFELARRLRTNYRTATRPLICLSRPCASDSSSRSSDPQPAGKGIFSGTTTLERNAG